MEIKKQKKTVINMKLVEIDYMNKCDEFFDVDLQLSEPTK